VGSVSAAHAKDNGGTDTLVFIMVSGGFAAIVELISSFVARNYEYPGQSVLWVFTFIVFGWIGMCGTCLFIAEGILAHTRQPPRISPLVLALHNEYRKS